MSEEIKKEENGQEVQILIERLPSNSTLPKTKLTIVGLTKEKEQLFNEYFKRARGGG